MSRPLTPPDWTPADIKAELVRLEVSQADIARDCGVHRATVSRVISGDVVSDKVRRQVARAIKRDPALIWPQAYLRKGGPRTPGRPKREIME